VVVLAGGQTDRQNLHFPALFPKHAFVSFDLPVEVEQAKKLALFSNVIRRPS